MYNEFLLEDDDLETSEELDTDNDDNEEADYDSQEPGELAESYISKFGSLLEGEDNELLTSEAPDHEESQEMSPEIEDNSEDIQTSMDANDEFMSDENTDSETDIIEGFFW